MFNKSDCWCCHKCDKHLVNSRHGYIIPCEERNVCQEYQAHLLHTKELREQERFEKLCLAGKSDEEMRKERKRRYDEKRRSKR